MYTNFLRARWGKGARSRQFLGLFNLRRHIISHHPFVMSFIRQIWTFYMYFFFKVDLRERVYGRLMGNRRQNVFAFLPFKSPTEVHTCWKRTCMDPLHVLECLSSIAATQRAWRTLPSQEHRKCPEKCLIIWRLWCNCCRTIGRKWKISMLKPLYEVYWFYFMLLLNGGVKKAVGIICRTIYIER